MAKVIVKKRSVKSAIIQIMNAKNHADHQAAIEVERKAKYDELMVQMNILETKALDAKLYGNWDEYKKTVMQMFDLTVESKEVLNG